MITMIERINAIDQEISSLLSQLQEHVSVVHVFEVRGRKIGTRLFFFSKHEVEKRVWVPEIYSESFEAITDIQKGVYNFSKQKKKRKFFWRKMTDREIELITKELSHVLKEVEELKKATRDTLKQYLELARKGLKTEEIEEGEDE